LDLDDWSPAQRKEDALTKIEQHHPRVAKSIRAIWGYPECSDYIQKLIMNGGDGMGQTRMGFNKDAAAAMMVLSGLHDAEFGAKESGAGFSLADPNTGTGWTRAR
jgi:hypothetical protein